MASPVLLVVGGSRGIGAAIALAAAREGYDVALSYVSAAEQAEAVAEGVRALGRRALVIQADTGREADIAALFAAVDSFGTLGALVYNTGVTGPHSKLDAATDETVRRVIEVNALGAILCAREAVRRMSTVHGGSGGGVVLVSSRASLYGSANEFVWYAATKGALDSFTVGLAREVGREGVRVNAVAPGPIATEMHRPGRLEEGVQRTALGRAGTPEEVAEAVMFLLSDRASYTTGSILSVGGGV